MTIKQLIFKMLLFFRDLFLRLCVRVDVSIGSKVSKEEHNDGEEDAKRKDETE